MFIISTYVEKLLQIFYRGWQIEVWNCLDRMQNKRKRENIACKK